VDQIPDTTSLTAIVFFCGMCNRDDVTTPFVSDLLERVKRLNVQGYFMGICIDGSKCTKNQSDRLHDINHRAQLDFGKNNFIPPPGRFAFKADGVHYTAESAKTILAAIIDFL
jgi:hypothetical protein